MTDIAFELGYDHYRLMIPIKYSQYSEPVRKGLGQGYRAAKIGACTRKVADLFERKLILIRDRALIKEMEVTITAQDLRDKLKEAGTHCPIIKEPFTFAQSDRTDWSVDRIDNTRDYTPDNIVIISKFANSAKGGMDLAGMIKKIFSGLGSNRMVVSDWITMVVFYYDKLQMQNPFSVITNVLLEDDGFFNQLVVLQLFRHEHHLAKPVLKKLQKYLGRTAVDSAIKLVTKRIYRFGFDEHCLIALTESPKLIKFVETFKDIIRKHAAEFDRLMLDYICLHQNLKYQYTVII